jgi:hypothetical protein
LCFITHPITALLPILVLFATIGYSFFLKQLSPLRVTQCAVVFVAIVAPLLIQNLSQEAPAFGRASDEWMDILRGRNSYLFFSSWSIHGWYRLFLSVFLAMTAWLTLQIGRDSHSRTYISVVNPFVRGNLNVLLTIIIGFTILLYLAALIFTEVLPIPLIFQFQPARSVLVITIFGYLLTSYVAYRLFIEESTNLASRLLLAAGLIMINWVEFLRTDITILGGLLLMIVFTSTMVKSRVTVLIVGCILFSAFSFLEPVAIFLSLNSELSVFLVSTLKSLRLLFSLSFVLLLEALIYFAREKVNPQRVRAAGLIFIVACAALLPNKAMVSKLSNYESFSQHINIPGYKLRSPWQDVQLWINGNTAKDATILVPPQSSGFRIWSKRSSVGDKKDGGPVIYSERYAKEWRGRMNDLSGYEEKTFQELCVLKFKYQADYAVVTLYYLENNSVTPMYANEEFAVLDVRTKCDEES